MITEIFQDCHRSIGNTVKVFHIGRAVRINGEDLGDFVMEIDFEKLALQMKSRAAKASLRATALDGAIKIRPAK